MKYSSDIHHRRSIRLKEFDYSENGAYFVTVVCWGREPLLESDQASGIVQSVWNGLPKRFPSIEPDEFVIMPNHVHGLIHICNPLRPNSGGAIRELPLRGDRRLRRLMTLSMVVGYFKMNTSKRINQSRQTVGQPVWQRNYYEHVIRVQGELERVRQYIRDNPLNWETDEENPNRKFL